MYVKVFLHVVPLVPLIVIRFQIDIQTSNYCFCLVHVVTLVFQLVIQSQCLHRKNGISYLFQITLDLRCLFVSSLRLLEYAHKSIWYRIIIVRICCQVRSTLHFTKFSFMNRYTFLSKLPTAFFKKKRNA